MYFKITFLLFLPFWLIGQAGQISGIPALDPSSLKSFAKISCLTSILKDIDGNIYPKVFIGTQCWTQENLIVTRYRDGNNIALNVSGGPRGNGSGQTWGALKMGARTAYNHHPPHYGYLYNWYAVANSHGLCPTGWHVPNNADWGTLLQFLSPNAGNKMKYTFGWLKNTGATNSSGFSGKPDGGRYIDGSFSDKVTDGIWWSSTQKDDDTDFAWCRSLRYDSGNLPGPSNYKSSGFSVRCLRD